MLKVVSKANPSIRISANSHLVTKPSFDFVLKLISLPTSFDKTRFIS
ncbi:MAG: hypothetical protein WCG25_02095 [bacterium]